MILCADVPPRYRVSSSARVPVFETEIALEKCNEKSRFSRERFQDARGVVFAGKKKNTSVNPLEIRRQGWMEPTHVRALEVISNRLRVGRLEL